MGAGGCRGEALWCYCWWDAMTLLEGWGVKGDVKSGGVSTLVCDDSSQTHTIPSILG
jgi:hypothetical protein